MSDEAGGGSVTVRDFEVAVLEAADEIGRLKADLYWAEQREMEARLYCELTEPHGLARIFVILQIQNFQHNLEIAEARMEVAELTSQLNEAEKRLEAAREALEEARLEAAKRALGNDNYTEERIRDVLRAIGNVASVHTVGDSTRDPVGKGRDD